MVCINTPANHLKLWSILTAREFSAVNIQIPLIILLFSLGENTILVPTFWGYNQFDFYILVTVNLVIVIFNL